MSDRLPHARVHHPAYYGGKFGVKREGTDEFLPLKRPFGSVTATYKWLDRSGYSEKWVACGWAEYEASEQWKADHS